MTLGGQFVSDDQKAQAESLAKSIAGAEVVARIRLLCFLRVQKEREKP